MLSALVCILGTRACVRVGGPVSAIRHQTLKSIVRSIIMRKRLHQSDVELIRVKCYALIHIEFTQKKSALFRPFRQKAELRETADGDPRA